MASIINASTSGVGGVITTADNSGNLNIQSGGSTKIAVTSAGVAVTGLAKASLPTGSVLQVVQSVYTTGSSTSSISYIATGVAATITPTSATSKILVIVSAYHYVTNSGAYAANTTIFRGTTSGTNLGDGTYGFGYYTSGTSGTPILATRVEISYLDSPATTSATTYTYAARVNNAACSIATSAGTVVIPSTITLMEIAA
jgi:hypothetical protein